MQSFDPIYLQRLVDGELDRTNARKLLEMAETSPHLWREMAGAFVENQFWQQDFEQLNHDDANNRMDPVSRPSESPTILKMPYWLSLAAGIMLALTTGLLIGRNLDGLTGSDHLPRVGNAPASPGNLLVDQQPSSAAMGNQTLVDYRPDYHLELEDANGNPYFGSEVPLYSAATAQKAGIRLDQPSQIPSDFVDRVNRNGYGIRQNMNYISGRLNDGRQFVVPVRTINLSPGQ
jgi:hypothetical protein